MAEIPVLVTGGAGYIGSHTCYALKQRGYLPITLDNLKHGRRKAVRFGPFIEGDIGDTKLVENICAEYKPKAALHFAALIEVGESVKSPDLYMKNNWKQAERLFGALQTCGVGHVVFSSTAAVYGLPSHNGAVTESHPLKPINPYGESKLEAENSLRSIKSINSAALRYFNAAGALADAELGEAHWPESHLVPNALLSSLGLKKEPLTIFGADYDTPDGTAIRDYVHVMDLAEAHLLALEYLLKGGANTAINLGSGKGASVKQVIDMIEKTTGKAAPCVKGPRRSGDPASLIADIGKASEILGWRPKQGLDAIIASAWQWHKSAAYRDLIGLRP